MSYSLCKHLAADAMQPSAVIDGTRHGCIACVVDEINATLLRQSPSVLASRVTFPHWASMSALRGGLAMLRAHCQIVGDVHSKHAANRLGSVMRKFKREHSTSRHEHVTLGSNRRPA